MGYKSETLIKSVREAREAAGVSQRALSARAGLTQSHISQIESGKMEPGLSSFIDMARALELEVVVVPKKLVPAVKAIVGAETDPAMRAATQQGDDRRIIQAEREVRKLKTIYGTSADLDRIEAYLKFLRQVSMSPEEMKQLHDLVGRMGRHQTSPQAAPEIREIRQEIENLRNAIVHAVPSAPKPAYSLDDEDKDA